MRSSEAVKMYVPDVDGVKAGRTARISEAEPDLSEADGEVLGAEGVDDVEEGQMTVTLSSQETLQYIAHVLTSMVVR